MRHVIPPDIKNVIQFMHNYRQFNSELSTELKPLGLSIDGCLVLYLLNGATDQTTTKLADRLGLNLPTATKLLDRLVADNYVHRKPHPSDRRVIRILLTQEGEEKAVEAESVTDQFLKDFSRKEPKLARMVREL